MEGEQGELGPSSKGTEYSTFSEFADALCSCYMSMGMTYDEYWHGNYAKLPYYYKSFEIERERANHDAWLQCGYFYDALCMVAPMLHPFAKRGAKPTPYHKEPYKFSTNSAEPSKPAKTDEELQEIRAINASAKFSSLAAQWNKRFESNGGEPSGSD